MFVPEPNGEGNASEAGVLDLLNPRQDQVSYREVLAKALVAPEVDAVGVGHDVRDAGFGRSSDQLAVRLFWCGNGQGNDKEVLAGESGDKRLLIVVVDVDNSGTLGIDGFAPDAGQSRDSVSACLKKILGEELSRVSSGLKTQSVYKVIRQEPT